MPEDAAEALLAPHLARRGRIEGPMDIDDHTNNSTPDGVNSRSQQVWGLRYIDDAMVRLLDKNLDGDCRDSGELFWQLSDAQFSTVAVIDKNAVLQERVSYTSYGVGTHRWPHEVNNTGGVTTSGSTSDYGVIDGLPAPTLARARRSVIATR